MTSNLLKFPRRRLFSSEARAAAERVLSMPMAERAARTEELSLEDPETVMALLGILAERGESVPASVLEEAEFLYRFLSQPKRRVGVLDETEFFLGETSLIAGTQCRTLSRREGARRWFDRAEAYFRLTIRTEIEWSRLAYQRLALRLEERAYDEVLELAPLTVESFTRLGMSQDALKCRFLEALAYQEIGQTEEALVAFEKIAVVAETAGYDRLFAHALNNLFMLHAKLGNLEEAVTHSGRALPILKRLGNRVGMAKLQWNLGDLFRFQGRTLDALIAYRTAREEAEQLGLRGDVAALHLIVADVLLDSAQERQAECEIRAAFPIIDEEKMVPEGLAALSLLRESLRRRQIDRQALRQLHGYFRDGES